MTYTSKNVIVKTFFFSLLLLFISSSSFAAEDDMDKKKLLNNHHAMHGMIDKNTKNFVTTSYNESRTVRAITRPVTPTMNENSKAGKVLAYSKKGRCLTCHIMEADGAQAGNVGPNLSLYAGLGHDKAYTFQQVWDARAHNPKTVMPPFGTNELLSRHEVNQIVSYLETLNTLVKEPKRPKQQDKNYLIAYEYFTLADIYVDDGEKLFNAIAKNGKSCASCHTQDRNLKGIATTYPKFDISAKKVIGLEQRINICQKKYKNSKPYLFREIKNLTN